MTHQILVIDDDTGILEALQAVLEDEGYMVSVATTIAPALELLQDTAALPNLILLDVLISGGDGREVCRQLKGNPRTRAIPVILMSAHPDIEAMTVACGADAALPKPYDIDQLISLIEQVASRAGR